ncbi:MAG: hypothetical protein ACFFC3_09875 [Candidatus Odinarchaeota archaeon]
MSENALKTRISALEAEIIRKDNEIHNLLDRIEELEDTVMRLDALIPDEDNKKKSKKKQIEDSKLAIELDLKDRKIRELKNNMGFLRKEKVQIQQELERLKSRSNESSVIRVEDFRSKTPLNALVKDLQEKINKQQSLIQNLKNELAAHKDFNEKLNQKDREIKGLKTELTDLTRKIKEISAVENNNNGDSNSKIISEDLQEQLNKYKRKVDELKLAIEKSTKKSKEDNKATSNIEDLQKEITDLNESLKNKDKEIEELRANVMALKKADIAFSFEKDDSSSTEIVSTLKNNSQEKLTRAKLQIKSLQEQIRKNQTIKSSSSNETQDQIELKLKMQREMALFLQKQLDTKEGEIEMIKNEAVQIKTKYRQLENQLKIKDQKIRELQQSLDGIDISPQIQSKKENGDIALRVRELKNKMLSLEKLSREQKLEIAHLRKNT